MKRATVILLLGSIWFGVAVAEARSLLAGWSTAQDTSPASANVTKDGSTLFSERGCAHCHQINGAGGDKGPDLSGVGRRMKKDAIKRQIEQGGKMMPAFGQALPDEEIAALVDYLDKCRDKRKSRVKP